MGGTFGKNCLLAGWLFLLFFGVAFAEETGKNLLPNPSFEQSQGSDGTNIASPDIDWKKGTYIKDPNKAITAAERHNRPDSKSTLYLVEGGCTGKYAAAAKLDSNDEWMLVDNYFTLPQPVRPGDRYRFSVMAKSDKPAQIDLYTAVLNDKTNIAEEGRVRYTTTGEWRRYGNVLFLTADTAGTTRIRLVFQLYTPGVQVLFDDAVLQKSDEKTSWEAGLIGTGSEATFVVLKNGDVLVVWDGLKSKVSHDGGKIWDRIALLRTEANEPLKGFSPGLFRMKSGAIGLVYDTGDGQAMQFSRSADEGKTWSAPVRIDKGDQGWIRAVNGSTVVLKNGRILVPVMHPYGPSSPTWSGWTGITTYCLISDDEGKTWTKGSEAKVVHDGKMLTFEEAQLVELKDGRLLMHGRTVMGRLFRAYSTDAGLTWSEPEPTPLVSSYAPGCLTRIPATGDLLAIWNQSSIAEVKQTLRRHRLSTAVSSDEGKTWIHFRNLESLDDVAKIKDKVNWDVFSFRHEPEYKQPTDLKRYRHAPGPLRCAYPACTFWKDRVIIAYDFGCDLDPVGQVTVKVQSLPVTWLYGR